MKLGREMRKANSRNAMRDSLSFDDLLRNLLDCSLELILLRLSILCVSMAVDEYFNHANFLHHYDFLSGSMSGT